MTSTQLHTLKIVLAFAAVYFFWGSSYLGIKIAIETIPTFFMAGSRFILSGLLLFALEFYRSRTLPKLNDWKNGAILSIFFVLSGNGGVAIATEHLPSSIAALMISTEPFWVLLLGPIFGTAMPKGKRVLVGLVLGFIGLILLMTSKGTLTRGNTPLHIPSLFVLVGAAVMWATGSLLSAKKGSRWNRSRWTTPCMMLFGGWVVVSVSMMGPSYAQWNGVISTRSLIATLYLSFFCTFIAMTAYLWIVKNVDPVRASTYAYVNPLVAVLLGWLLANEPITPLLMVVGGLILAGLILVLNQPKARSRR